MTTKRRLPFEEQARQAIADGELDPAAEKLLSQPAADPDATPRWKGPGAEMYHGMKMSFGPRPGTPEYEQAEKYANASVELVITAEEDQGLEVGDVVGLVAGGEGELSRYLRVTCADDIHPIGVCSYKALAETVIVTHGRVTTYGDYTPGGVCFLGWDGKPVQLKPGYRPGLKQVIRVGYGVEPDTMFVNIRDREPVAGKKPPVESAIRGPYTDVIKCVTCGGSTGANYYVSPDDKWFYELVSGWLVADTYPPGDDGLQFACCLECLRRIPPWPT